MTIIKNLNIKYRGSSNTWMDGSAVAHMLLEHSGILPTDWKGKTDHEIQELIDSEIQQNNSEPDDWYCDPDGMYTTLNNLNQDSSNKNVNFKIQDCDDVEEICRKITYSLHQNNLPSAALVFHGGFWTMIKGVQTDLDPLSNNKYSILGFWIHNPWPELWGEKVQGVPSQNIWISYDEWINTYMTVNNYSTPESKWFNKFISICDPDPLDNGQLITFERESYNNGNDFLKPDELENILSDELKKLDMFQIQELKSLYETGRPDIPILVQRLDLPDTYNYMVPWRRDNQIILVFQLDARFGNLNEIAMFTSEKPREFLGREELFERLNQGLIELHNYSHHTDNKDIRHNHLHLRPGTWSIHDSLVWLPCWESRSPAFPFYLLSVSDRHYYISTVDGTTYSKLHAFNNSNRYVRGGA